MCVLKGAQRQEHRAHNQSETDLNSATCQCAMTAYKTKHQRRKRRTGRGKKTWRMKIKEWEIKERLHILKNKNPTLELRHTHRHTHNLQCNHHGGEQTQTLAAFPQVLLWQLSIFTAESRQAVWRQLTTHQYQPSEARLCPRWITANARPSLTSNQFPHVVTCCPAQGLGGRLSPLTAVYSQRAMQRDSSYLYSTERQWFLRKKMMTEMILKSKVTCLSSS